MAGRSGLLSNTLVLGKGGGGCKRDSVSKKNKSLVNCNVRLN